MPRDDLDIELQRRGDGAQPPPATEAESLGSLFKRLTTDTGELIRQEVNLAKVELRETGATLARDGVKIAIAFGLALAGVLAFTAFLVVVLGDAFDNYWLGALVVAVLVLAVGAFLAKSAVNDIKRRGLKPEETIQTVREDAAWAKHEAREFKRELTT